MDDCSVKASFRANKIDFDVGPIPYRLEADPKKCRIQVDKSKLRVQITIPAGKNVIFRTSDVSFLLVLQNGDVFVCTRLFTCERVGDVIEVDHVTTSPGGDVIEMASCAKQFIGNCFGDGRQTEILNGEELTANSLPGRMQLAPPRPKPVVEPFVELETAGETVWGEEVQRIKSFVREEELDGLEDLKDADEFEEMAEKVLDKLMRQYKGTIDKFKVGSSTPSAAAPRKRVGVPTTPALAEHSAAAGPKKRKPIRLRRFLCQLCGKAMRNRSELADHMLGHGEARNFVCKVCGAAFKTIRNMRKHRTKVHNKILAKLPCSECDRKFSTVVARRVHTERVHCEGYVKPAVSPLVACEDCGKDYRENRRKKHLKTCTGPSAATLEELKSEEEEEAPSFICRTGCTRQFSSLVQLERHEKSCTAAPACPFCSWSFDDFPTLAIHLRQYHPNKYEYACPPCLLTCTINHTRKGEKCPTCQKCGRFMNMRIPAKYCY